MLTEFNVVRAVALCKKIISKAGKEGVIHYTKLLKLVYLIERQMYESFREFITNDTFVSMPYGPVPSTLYNLIKGEMWDEHLLRYWTENFKTKNYDLIDNNIETEKTLSADQNLVAEKVLLFFKDYTWKDLVTILHEICPEYQKTNSSIPISLEDIQKHVYPLTADEIAKEIIDT